MTQASVTTNRFADRRRRAAELKERYGTAAEVLSFYAHILEVQESAFGAASTALPEPENVAAYAAEYVLPQIVDVSTAVGPPQLVQSVLERFEEADFEDVLSRWLRSEALDGTDRFLARASTAPVLAALGRSAGIACRRKAGDRGCPQCGGLPQVGFFAASTENFVTAHRYLECSRCAHTWAFARMRCANCGETESSRLLIYDEIETPRFTHIRIDGCSTCKTYLHTIDLTRDRRAVPVVDEIAAIPLDFFAKERGLQKIVPNLMGF